MHLNSDKVTDSQKIETLQHSGLTLYLFTFALRVMEANPNLILISVPSNSS